jgi:sulfonate transport system substrate-binding protein
MDIMKLKAQFLALLGLAIATPAIAADPLTIRIAWSQIGVGGRQFAALQTSAIAHSEGFLAEEFKNDPNIKFEYIFFKGAGPATNEAVANGQVDFFSQGDLPSIIGRASGLETKILLNVGGRQSRYLAVLPNSDIKSIEDLRGRKVAQHRGTNITLSISKIIAAHGLTERDIKFLNMDNATAIAALLSGDIDAAFGTQNLLELAQQGKVKIVYSSKNDDPTVTSNSTFLVTDDFEQKHPDITQRVVNAVVKAAAWASDEANRDKVFAAWAKSGVPAEIYRAEFDGQPLKLRNSPLIDEFLVSRYREQSDYAKQFGLIRQDVSVDGWFEPKYLEQALKDLGLERNWDRYDASGRVVQTAQAVP